MLYVFTQLMKAKSRVIGTDWGQELVFNNEHVSLRCLYFLIESVWYF